jgi:RNA polymerase sigma factor (sigma-70 family)
VTVTVGPNITADSAALEFAALFRDEFAAVTRSAYLVLHDRDAAEDVAQDAFAQLLKHWDKVSGYERPDAWVRRVAIRLAVRAARRDQLRDRLLGWISPPTRVAETSDPDLTEAMRALPPQQRAAVALYYFEDRPVSEIADLLGCSRSTAKVHLFKARKRLAILLHEPDVENSDAT